MAQESQKDELIDNILKLTDEAFQELLPMLPKEWLHIDVTISQLKVILLLFISGPLRMGDIASELEVSMATATGVIDRLVERGMLIRDGDPEDRRVVLCRLSDEGEKLLSGMWKLSKDQLAKLWGAMTTPQLVVIAEALQILLQRGKEVRDGTPGD
jgi:DNA-binding MarR family transcriptional regulator